MPNKNQVNNPDLGQPLMIDVGRYSVEMSNRGKAGLSFYNANSQAVVEIDARRKCTSRTALAFACSAAFIIGAAVTAWVVSRDPNI